MSTHRHARRYAIIPTHNRHDLVGTLATILSHDVDCVVVIDNASDIPLTIDHLGQLGDGQVAILRDDEQPPNLSRLWNVCLDYVEDDARKFGLVWDVAVLNDDTVLPSGWFDAVSSALRAPDESAVIACGALVSSIHSPLRKTKPDADLMTRMTPWAFIMRGEVGLRGDESLRWWWGDTDLDFTARTLGGVLIIPGYFTQNVCANSTTHGALAEQAGRDRETFRQKWGFNPW